MRRELEWDKWEENRKDEESAKITASNVHCCFFGVKASPLHTFQHEWQQVEQFCWCRHESKRIDLSEQGATTTLGPIVNNSLRFGFQFLPSDEALSKLEKASSATFTVSRDEWWYLPNMPKKDGGGKTPRHPQFFSLWLTSGFIPIGAVKKNKWLKPPPTGRIIPGLVSG